MLFIELILLVLWFEFPVQGARLVINGARFLGLFVACVPFELCVRTSCAYGIAKSIPQR